MFGLLSLSSPCGKPRASDGRGNCAYDIRIDGRMPNRRQAIRRYDGWLVLPIRLAARPRKKTSALSCRTLKSLPLIEAQITALKTAVAATTVMSGKQSAVFSRHHWTLARSARAILLTGIIALGVAIPIAPAAAQDLFDFFFDRSRRSGPPTSQISYRDPNAPEARPDAGPRLKSGPSVAYCVRLCDGRFFPIQRSSGVDPAQTCSTFCPATRTKIFSGGVINHAVASDGARYAELQNAFVYRDRVVADCTCNRKNAFGLVTTSANEDPTLRPGDIVATERGFVAYSGGRRNAKFTPIGSYGGLSADMRQRLANSTIVPRNTTPVPNHDAASAAGNRHLQLER